MSNSNSSSAKPASVPDSPGVIVFPPLLYVGTLLVGVGLNWVWPAPFLMGGATWARWAGGALILASGFVAHWASRTMREAGTNVLPSKPALTLVTNGPFRFTRNPLYVMNALVYLGLTLILNSAWLLGLFVPMLLVIYWGIIRREERYLEAKFGEAYLAYKARVRRWI